VVLAENPEEAAAVIRKGAKQCQSDLIEIRNDQYEVLREDYDGNSFCWRGEEYRIPLPGRHQVSNAVTALEAAVCLLGKDHRHSSATFRRGLAHTSWPARLEIIGRDPLIYRDGAHNPDGACKLADFLQKHFTNKSIIYIIGVLKDKEYEKMMAYLLPFGQKAYVFRPDNARGLDAAVLADLIRTFGKEAVICQGVRDALNKALACADKEDILVACGSLSFMGELDAYRES
jgi:dihydrofolate synthase/folylpolyglutamate synthase